MAMEGGEGGIGGLFLAASPVHKERSCKTNGRVGTYSEADDKSQNEPLNIGRTEEEKADEHDEGRNSCVKGTSKALNEAAACDYFEGLCAVLRGEIVAEAVENHDGVIHGVADDREEGGDKERIEFEGCGVAQDHEDSYSKEDDVNERDDGSDPEFPWAVFCRNIPKCDGDVENNADECEDEGAEGAFCHG